MIELEMGCERLADEETTLDVECSVPVYKKKRKVNLLELHTSKKDTYRIKEEITLPGTKESIGQLLLTDICSRKLDIRLEQDELRLGRVTCILYVSVRRRENRLVGRKRSL